MLCVLLACANPALIVEQGPSLSDTPRIALAPTVLLQDLPGGADPFTSGEYVGDVWLSGGFERMPENNNQIRSVHIELREQDAYAAQGKAWLDGAFAALLDARGAAWSPLQEDISPALTRPVRTDVRGTGPLDGADDQHLPRFTLRPAPLDPAALPALPAGTEAILVPILVHYYSHNGGWFVGQAKGNPAGARIRLLWSLHDVSDGRVLTWSSLESRYLEPYYYSPNQAELQDYLIATEEELVKTLGKTALR